jgi:hypothetical protein
LNLSFGGIIETAESGADCIYKIPTLTIRFAKQEGLATTAINLDKFRVVIFASAGDKRTLLERRYPLLAALTSAQNEVHVQDIEFTVPKQILRQAEYVALAVVGQPVFDIDGRLAAVLSPEDKARLLNSRALWPISAKPNIAYQTVSPDGEHGRIIYRTPRDPNDDCSSVKIR